MELIVCIMGQNCEQTIGMCLESVKSADKIIYCDGGGRGPANINKSQNIAENMGATIIGNKYNQDDKAMNGKQRNFYLNYLKEHYLDDWCLCLDADEVLEDYGIEKIKQMIENLEPMLLSPRIHHFVGDLGHEDATREQHFVPNRLFKITNDITYNEVEHPVLTGLKQGTIDVHIYHLREVLGIFGYRNKHLNNWRKSNMHSKQYLNWWNNSMMLGNYPRKPVYFGQIPTPIKNHFYLYQDA